MDYNRFKILVVGVFLFLFSWSCESYLEQFNMDKLSTEIELKPSIAAPVAYGSFSLQDILETLNDSMGLVSITEDSLIYLFYADTAYSLNADELIEIPDHISTETYIQSDINVPGWLAIGVGEEYTFHKLEKMQFVIEPEDRIDSIMVKAGSLNLDAFSEFRHAGELNITSGNIIDPTGDTLNLTFMISDTLGTFTTTESYDLSDYKVTMDESNDSAFVKIYFNLKLIKSNADILTDEEAGIEMTFSALEYSKVYGFIAERSISDINESIDFDIFNDIENIPDIYFGDPQFIISVHNSFGVPLSLNINRFSARSHIDGSYLDLIFKNDTMNPFDVKAPTVAQLGEVITSSRNYSVETCNIDELISSVPDRIELELGASSGNPSGSTEQNFLLDTSKMVLEAEVLLPLWLSASGYTLRDTLDLAFDSLMANLNFIESAMFRLTTVNEWPLEIAVQIYFLDDSDEVIDSLFQEKTALLDSAPVNADGELEESELVPNEIIVELLKEDLLKLEDATRLMFVATANTTDNGSKIVKFFSHYLLNYQLSIAADFRINPSEVSFE